MLCPHIQRILQVIIKQKPTRFTEIKLKLINSNFLIRYRKSIRAIEQGIEEVPSIVPARKQTTGREVPLNTNSELILFCRRVYEFRLRRLIKNPS